MNKKTENDKHNRPNDSPHRESRTGRIIKPEPGEYSQNPSVKRDKEKDNGGKGEPITREHD